MEYVQYDHFGRLQKSITEKYYYSSLTRTANVNLINYTLFSTRHVEFQFTQLRKEASDVDAEASIVSAALMCYSWGCQKVQFLVPDMKWKI